LNDNSSVIPKVVHGSGMINNQALPMNNLHVYQLFDKCQMICFVANYVKKYEDAFYFPTNISIDNEQFSNGQLNLIKKLTVFKLIFAYNDFILFLEIENEKVKYQQFA
jgi:hypothetical protein